MTFPGTACPPVKGPKLFSVMRQPCRVGHDRRGCQRGEQAIGAEAIERPPFHTLWVQWGRLSEYLHFPVTIQLARSLGTAVY